MSYSVDKRPCSTCPYACSTPPAVWHVDEYEKLPEYDKETAQQPFEVFMCHAGDAETTLCAGWLAVHNQQDHAHELLSLRFAGADEDLWGYTTDVALWSSGYEAFVEGTRPVTIETSRAIDKAQRAQDRRNG